jgi:hypothetical protein
MQSLETRVEDFLAQNRIAVAGVSRDNSRHPVGNLIFRRLKTTGHQVSRSTRTWRRSKASAAIRTCSPSLVESMA